jgi:methylmalonyl-CoA mutase
LPATARPLAEGFPPATRADWEALVERTLRVADADSLVIRGPDCLEIQPLYEPSLEPRKFAPAPRGGERPWDVRGRVRHRDPARAHDAILDELAGGAASVLVTLDSGRGEGVSIASAEAVAELLDGVMIDVAPVALDAGFLGVTAAEWLSAAAKGSPAAPLAFHLDPLGAFAREGASPGPFESHLAAAANVAARLAPIHPRASFFLASGAVVHDAGGTPAQELAFVLASSLAYAKAMTRVGLSVEQSLSITVLSLTVDSDPMISIAKLRAGRLVWTRLAGALGTETPATIEAHSSARMLTKVDPWTNMVRLTAAGMAAAVGGANAVALGAFTDALGLPTAFARRMARNTQLILMEEGHLGAIADPVGGSGAFEALSQDLARAAWAEFNAIEASGGLAAALRNRHIARGIEMARDGLAEALGAGDLRIVGVTDFRAEATRPAPIDAEPFESPPAPDARLPGPDSHCPPLVAITLEGLAG